MKQVVAALALMMASWSQTAPPPPRFRTSTDAVRVDVSVWRGGRPVAGLTADNFDVRDNGVRQQVRTLDAVDEPIDLLIVVDVSGSITGDKLAALQDAGRALVDASRQRDRIAIMSFSHVVRLDLPWSTDRLAARLAIDRLHGADRTSLYDAVSAASLFAGHDLNARRHLLLISDGFDTTSSVPAAVAIDQVKRSNLNVHVIRVGYFIPRYFARGAAAHRQRRRLFLDCPELVPSEFLPTLAEESGAELIEAENDGALRSLCLRVSEAMRASYVLSYVPAGVSGGGWHAIDVTLKNARGTATARRGYQR